MNDFSDFYIKKLYAVNQIRQKKPIRIHRDCRPFFALAYKIAGKSIYRCEGKEYVSDNRSVILLQKGSNYELDCIEPGLCFMIEFDSDSPIESFHSFPVSDARETEKLFRAISKTWTLKDDNFVTKTLAATYELMYRLFVTEKMSYQAKKKRERIRPAIDYIEQHYYEHDISNELLASVVNMSVVYFRKLFTEIYAVSPIRYVQNLRIERAKELLLSDYDSIGNVAEAVGFSNIYSFSRTFKRNTGLSPSTYILHEK